MFEEDVFKKVINLLNGNNIPYMLTGGLAVTVWGRARSTLDIDIVLDIKKVNIKKLTNAFQKENFYIDEEAVEMALDKKFSFNAIDKETNTTIDCYLIGNNKYEAGRFQRKIIKNIVGIKVSVISPEDLVLIKLQWHKDSGSTRHLEDAESILKISKVDLKYIKEWAGKQETINILKKLLKKIIHDTNIRISTNDTNEYKS
ncbi:hypothetical protein HZB04_02480 [Candidatus Wolfebacteria bacterium]|nr:hypothetical protein [Candidatus Wolfebacteria bacterium]